MYQIFALGQDQAVTWGDLLFIAIAVLVVLAIIFFVRRT